MYQNIVDISISSWQSDGDALSSINIFKRLQRNTYIEITVPTSMGSGKKSTT